jgi:hypothetical protein
LVEVDPGEAHRKTRLNPKTTVLILVALVATLSFLGWRNSRISRFSIPSLAKASQHRLTGASPDPDTLWIRVSGWVDGKATLQLTDREAVPIGPGPVDWAVGVDYFEPACLLRYTPSTVTQGELLVEYRLH